ncbi:hypothetical protein H072_1737 [Dactylellina haptotyla CBS 200.50]|uniref:Protein kinase domain-containing protein n=1 Tax=Dactylellina haptotyla (strain CBS 200.50) TaxID=1284197 RepID=S8C9A4_DACHA|nr:hypothetical protein H072_1737 [Dactylellina haptotyla CBS 200.50]
MISSASISAPTTPRPGLGLHDILWEDLYKGGLHGILKEKHRMIHAPGWSDDGIFEYRGMAIKRTTQSREMEMAERAGDCGVKVLGHILRFDMPDGQPRKMGMAMEIATPLVHYIKTILDNPEEKQKIKLEMIAVVERLHTEYNMVHGDIKPLNFVVCKDRGVRLCDWETARPIDESTAIWETLMEEGEISTFTPRYNTKRDNYVPPTPADDMYALAISIWELYTDSVPLSNISDEDELEEFLENGGTVDLTKVEDDETREWIRENLRKGGAKV